MKSLLKVNLVILIAMLIICFTGTAWGVTLFTEDWESGITSDWRTWGSPTPLIQSGQGIGGSDAIDPGGDGTRQSGMNTYERFTLQEGLTLSGWIKGWTTTQYWNNIAFDFNQFDAVEMGDHSGGYGTRIFGMMLMTTPASGGGAQVQYWVGSDNYTRAYNPVDNGEYHNYAFTVNTDRTVTFTYDGAAEWTSTAQLDFLSYPDATFSLHGASVGNMILGDNISITAPDPVPEPATMLLLGTGLVGLAGFRRKNKK